MTDEPLAELADRDVPPLPPEFDNQLRQQMNRALVTRDLVEFGTQAAPQAAGQFARAALDLVVMTLTGRSTLERRRRRWAERPNT